MAFEKANWQKITSSLNDRQPRGWSYLTTTDNQATIEGSGYFNSIFDEITTGDFLYSRCTNDVRFYELIVSGSTVTLSDNIEIKNSYSFSAVTNSAGTLERFDMSIYPQLTARIATIIVTDTITGNTALNFDLKARDLGGSLVDIGTLTFDSSGSFPQRASVNFPANFDIGPYYEVYFQKTNDGTAQSVRFVASIDGTSLN